MPIFRLADESQRLFATAPEVFANAQFAKWHGKELLIIGSQIAIEFDDRMPSEFARFYGEIWGERVGPETTTDLIQSRYRRWMSSFEQIQGVEPLFITRNELALFVASRFPPPPPNRPSLAPRYVPPSAPLPISYGHLPFRTRTVPHEHFYRFEPWPSSRKITVGDPGVIEAETYASPAAELHFLNTGFAAVARNALPNLFPAVFRYELQPASTAIHCGAIVPNFGQSGGGVEVYFPTKVQNLGPIAMPVVIPPL